MPSSLVGWATHPASWWYVRALRLRVFDSGFRACRHRSPWYFIPLRAFLPIRCSNAAPSNTTMFPCLSDCWFWFVSRAPPRFVKSAGASLYIWRTLSVRYVPLPILGSTCVQARQSRDSNLCRRSIPGKRKNVCVTRRKLSAIASAAPSCPSRARDRIQAAFVMREGLWSSVERSLSMEGECSPRVNVLEARPVRRCRFRNVASGIEIAERAYYYCMP